MASVPPISPASVNDSGQILLNVNWSGTLLVINDTIYTLELQFDDGRVRYVPAQTPRAFSLCRNKHADWSVSYGLTVGVSAANIVTFEVHEDSPSATQDLQGIGPISRVFVVGNQGSIQTTGSNTLSNTGNPAGTPVITLADSAMTGGNNVSIENDGTTLFSVLSNGTYVTAFQITPGTASTPLSVLAALAKITSDNGAISSDGYGNLSAYNFYGALGGQLRATDIGVAGTSKPTLETYTNAGVTYDFYVQTWDGAASHQALLVDHTGLRYADTVPASGVASGPLSVTSINATSLIAGSASLTNASAGLEIGSTSATGTPYIDFHSDGTPNDYDVRLIASGGTSGTNGAGALSVYATSVTFTGSTVSVGSHLIAGSDVTVTSTTGNVQLGSQSATGTPYIDFHSDGSSTFDARIMASGGTSGTSGAGLLDVYVAQMKVHGTLTGMSDVFWAETYGDASGPRLSYDSANLRNQYWTKQSGTAQTSHEFVIWTGSAQSVPFGIGSGISAAPAYIDNSGNMHTPRVYVGGGGSLSGIAHISGSGSATVTHGLNVTPTAALVNTNNGSNSTTFGSDSYTSTTVYIYEYVAQAWTGVVYVG